MWVPKWQRDQSRGVDSPMPTQAVSNEEFVPRPQNQQQKQWEQLIGEMAEEKSKKLGMQRRDFMRTSMGLATAFLASNMVYGPNWDVDAAETLDPAATEEKFPKGEYFIIDVQTHFTDGVALGFRNAEFVRNMGFDLKDNPDAYSFTNFVKEIFFDSETSMAVISGVPGRETNKNLEGQDARRPRSPRRHSAQLADVTTQERIERTGRRPAGLLPRQLCPESLLGPHEQPAGFPGTVRTDGARGQEVRHRQLEMVLPHRSGPLWKRVSHGRRKDGLPVLREVQGAGPESIQRAQRLCRPVAYAGPLRSSRRHREGGKGPPRPDLHRLPLGAEARTGRAAISNGRFLRSGNGRFRMACGTDEDQAAQSGHEQRLSRDRFFLRVALDRPSGHVPALDRQEHPVLRIGPRHLGHRLPVVGRRRSGSSTR